jgi:dTDP-4-dehydrorhamnose 3,5-epimerase
LEISAENRTQFYIPAGFGHGFVTLSETAEFVYKCTAEYNKASEVGVRWDDPTIGIDWPLAGLEVSVSDKDAALPFLAAE